MVAAPESGVRCPVGSTGFHVFLSYRRVDVERARAIKLALEAIGYKVFMDITDEGAWCRSSGSTSWRNQVWLSWLLLITGYQRAKRVA